MNARRANFGAPQRQRGFTMMEILVTLFLLLMWLLASAGVQSSSLKISKAAQFRTQAVYLATELAERMQANKSQAVLGGYAYTGSTGESVTSCVAEMCTPATLAAFDLAEWSARVAAILPNASVTVSTPGAANPITYTILISWSDRRGDRKYSTTGTAETFSYTATKTIFNPPS